MEDKEMQKLEHVKELILTAKKLTVQLISLECDLEANKNCAAGSLVPKSNGDDKQALRTHGYVNWNSTHDILKTKHWKTLSEFTEYCGIVERGICQFSFGKIINMKIKCVVNEEVRFPEDNLYLNVSSPLVWAEILFIKELRKPTPKLVRTFLDTVKNDMHTRSSFEEKYGLKWAEPDSEACAITVPMQVLKPLAPILSPIDEQETWNNDHRKTKSVPDTISLREDAEPRKEDSSEEPTIFSEEFPNEHDQKGLEPKKCGSAIESTFSKENLVEDTQNAQEPNEVDSGKVPITFSKDSFDEDDFDHQKRKFTKVNSAEKPITVEAYPNEDDQKTLALKDVDSAEKPITNEAYQNEDHQKTLALKEVGSGEDPTLSQENLVEGTQILKPNEVDSAKQPITFRLNNLDENDQKTLEFKEVDLAEKLIFSKNNSANDEQMARELEEVDSADEKTLELYENFSVILEKVSQGQSQIRHTINFWELFNKVEELGINSEKRLGIVVDLLFEKAIEEPEFSKNYADFCKELLTLKVATDDNSDFLFRRLIRLLIIAKCQNEFEQKLLSNDPKDTDGLQMINDGEIRRTRVVATVRFIGELYKHNILTCKIMNFCLEKLTHQLEEEKLECLCELLTVIGKQMESQGSTMPLTCLNKMEEFVVAESNTINSRVKLMVKDVVDLGKSKWVMKSFVDAQIKTMDQIQHEAEKRAYLIQRMNASDGEQRGQGTKGGGDNSFMNIIFPQAKSSYYSVDTLQLIADTQDVQNYIKLPPACFKNISKNMLSVFEKFQADPTTHIPIEKCSNYKS